MLPHSLHVLLCLVSFALYLPGGDTEACGWEEKSSIALEKLVEPAIVLREYSDVNSARDCYLKCCELKDEGCNVASFMTYESGVICMNVKCEPFDNCKWGIYPTSIAAVISRPSNAVNNSFSSATVGNAPDTTSNATTSTVAQNHTDTENATGTTVNDTDSNVPGAEGTTPPPNVIVSQTPLGPTTTGPLVKPESKDPSNPFNPDYDPSLSGNGIDGGTEGGDKGGNDQAGNVNDNTNFSDNNDVSNGLVDEGGPQNTTLSINEAVHINYTISIAIGVLTLVAVLVVMYVAARKFRLFQDRSKYSRLLENPEQYADNFSASEFED